MHYPADAPESAMDPSSSPPATAGDRKTPRGPVWNALAVSTGVLVAVPLALVFAAWFYVSAVAQSVLMLGGALFRRQKQRPPEPVQRPHFDQTRTGAMPERRNDS